MTKYQTFFVPRAEDGAELEELNRFLRSHRILHVDRCYDAGGWAFLVEYAERGEGEVRAAPPRVDYREVLSPEDFAVFARLRDVRRELAERDGVAAFTVATNEQLAKIVTTRANSVAALKGVPGFGAARAEKYGAALLSAIRPVGTTDSTVRDDETDSGGVA